MDEIALVGRSNVGKSSLINHLTNHKKLAHVSSIPGKTQYINFFSIDTAFCLVDLPGYGFTKSEKKREDWGELTESYLERTTLRCILLLLDIRHPPSKDDIAFIEWAQHYKKNIVFIFTKTDKIHSGSIRDKCKKHLSSIYQENELNIPEIEYIPYSIKNAEGRKQLLHKLKGFINWDQ